jgi:hypothetical protein
VTDIRIAVERACVEDYWALCAFLGETLDPKIFQLGYLEYEAWALARKQRDSTLPLAS